MRHGKSAVGALLTIAVLAGTSGAAARETGGERARAQAELAAAPFFASVFERIWGLVLDVFEEARGTIVPGDGSGEGVTLATDDGVGGGE